jgi:lipopolysaccharide transport protein LptA
MEKLPAEKECQGPAAVLDVASERMTFDSRTRTFTFEDKVHIRRCALTIDCDRLQVINDASEKNVEQIIATGNVRIQHGQRHVVAERANYFEAEQKLVLVGNPRAWDTQEHNELRGEEIVIFLQEEKMFVKRARVIFQPRKTSSKTP